MTAPATYDSRYLAGIVLFNRRDYFEAHEVWENLWMDTPAPEKRFYQGLIQAAVALCHFCNGNLRGAAKLFASSRDYMSKYGSPFLGMDCARFWQDMQRCFAEVLATEHPDRHKIELPESLLPEITLDPVPDVWPDPADFVDERDD